MYYVYILYSITQNKFYIGFTKNYKRRVREHLSGNVYSTKRMGILKLVYYEAFMSKEDAKRRERYFKTTKGKKGLKLILRDTLKN